MLRFADCHNDLLLAVQHLRERGRRDPFGDIWLPQLISGGVKLQVLPIFTDEQFAGEAALRRCLLMIEQAQEIAEEHSTDVAIALSGGEITRILDSGRIALVLALEGSEPIGADLTIIRTLFRAGLRMASFTWNRRTLMADGAGERDTGGRLTHLGIASLAEMERLGLIVDVSHLSEHGFWHVAELATRPYIASHSSARSIYDHARNLTDDQMRAISASGGLICINGYGGFLGSSPTIGLYVDHIAHAIEVVGVEHVALGPDFIREVSQTVDPVLTDPFFTDVSMQLIPEFSGPRDLPVLADHLVQRFGSETAEKIAFSTLTRFLTLSLPPQG